VTEFISRHRYKIAIGLILALAAFFRFWQLAGLPPGLHPDEAANGLDVFRILEHHDFRPFYSTNGGREALFFYFQSIGVLIFGNTILGLRVAPAFLGTLAVGAIYLWISSWFGRRAGLLAALLLAVTPWAVTISRDGFRASELMLFVPLVLWLYTKAFQTGRNLWFALAGAALGLGFYTYIAFRMFPVALLGILVYLLIWRRTWLKQWWRRLALSLGVVAIVLIPMGIYTVQHPEDIAGRPGGVSFLNKDLNHGQPLQTLLDTTIKTALMFNIRGDENYRQNLGGQPELNIFVGVMFVLGIFISLTRLKHLRYAALLLVLSALLLPEVLTAEGIPHALRSIGALPAALALAAIGIIYVLKQWHAVFPLNRVARTGGTVAVAFLLVLTVYQGYVQYFVAWANSPDTYNAYAEDMVAISDYYDNHSFNGKRYAVTGEYSMQTVEFLTHQHPNLYQRYNPGDVDAIPLDQGVAKEFLTTETDKEKVLKRLELKFPNGKLSPHYSSFSGDELFVVYTVPAK
jgi:4-amino-4-deoxy-L-arabinose transferase-like glycosyltransferase